MSFQYTKNTLTNVHHLGNIVVRLMKRKTPTVMKNPRLDKIFAEAYRNTIRQVAVREQDKHDEDYYQTFSQLFEQDLYNRDLTAEEREQFMSAFQKEIESLQESASRRGARRRKTLLVGGSGLFCILALSFAIYTVAARPFMPVEKVTTNLDYYLGKVEDGYGSYTRKFYRVIDRQGGKLPVQTEAAYRSNMYATLDNHFDETIERLEAGEIRYYDDAKEWASRFPEPEERADRKRLAANAFKKGLGTSLGTTLEEAKEGVRDLVKKAADFIKDAVRGEE